MVCPSSGEISLLGIAREKQNDDYTDTTVLVGQNGNSPGTISLESCSTSGNNHGPQVVMEATNTNSPSYPDGSAPYAMSEFYGYDHDAASCTSFTYSNGVMKIIMLCGWSWTTNTGYHNGSGSLPTTGDDVYTNSGCTSAIANNRYRISSISYMYVVSGSVDSIGSCSDRRLKERIKLIGYSPSGLKIYSFEYKDKEEFGNGVYQGVMSDEVPQDAVSEFLGYEWVDYDKLDVEFKKIGEIIR